MIALAGSLAVGAGLALALVGVLRRSREREEELKTILEIPFGERDVAVSDMRIAFLEPGVAAAQAALERLKIAARIGRRLEQARVPLKPGEMVLVEAGVAAGGGLLLWGATGHAVLGALGAVAAPWLVWQIVVSARLARRRREIEEQLPEALTLVASSLEAGHTFHHALEMMASEIEPPIAQEFERVLAETRLGDPLVDALARMADRVAVGDVAWVVQAIRIQQTVGGKLADVLATLAEFMRARQEVRREVRVLTAEGRLSAHILGGLPFAVFAILQVLNPTYLRPLLEGWGLAALAGAAVSVCIGIAVILRMAKVEV